MVSGSAAAADVLIIGDGLIGLSIARELSRSERVVVVGQPDPGNASRAAAGLLIPALERLPTGARAFYADSLRRFPDLLNQLRAFDPGLALIEGVVDRSRGAEILRPDDAAVDNVRLTAALRAAVEASPNATVVSDLVSAVAPDREGVAVTTRDGRRFRAARAVLAAGAWSPRLDGLPRPLPVRPLKGQMIALGAAPLARSMMDEHVYLVPREHETLVGATVEDAGFDLTIAPEAVESLRRAAVRLCPALDGAAITRAWAGTRPATPDMLPILGADPDWPALIYACGHSKNGVLLTPATAVAIAALCRGESAPTPIDAFTISRFVESENSQPSIDI